MNRSVKNAAFAAIALASVAVAGSHAAQAADTAPVQKPFDLKIGAAFPSGGDTNAVFRAGGDWNFSKDTSTQPSIYSVYLDYYGKNDQSVFGGGVGIRKMLGSTMASGSPYVGAGLGVYTLNPANGGSNTTSLGGKVLAGYQFNEGYFGEVDYTILSKSHGSNLSAVGASVGYRF